MLDLQPPKGRQHTFDTDFVPPLPPAPPPRRREDPAGANCWFLGNKCVTAPAQATDAALGTTPSPIPTLLGFNWRSVAAWCIDPREKHLAQMASLAACTIEDGGTAPCMAGDLDHFGAAILAIRYAVANGWSHIRHDGLVADLTINAGAIDQAIENAGALFALARMDHVTVRLCTADVVFDTDTVHFAREDHPGFLGVFGALTDYARTGKAPEQNWLYVRIGPRDRDLMTPAGIRGREGSSVRTGSHLETGVSALVCGERDRIFSGAVDREAIYRFPASVASRMRLARGGGDCATLVSRTPFTIPHTSLQHYRMGRWVQI